MIPSWRNFGLAADDGSRSATPLGLYFETDVLAHSQRGDQMPNLVDDLFHNTDRWGRTIILREGIWYQKILHRHPELDGPVRAVELTIDDPDRVTFDATHEGGENYYRHAVFSYPLDADYLKVVVRFGERDK